MPCYDSRDDNREQVQQARKIEPLLCSACKALEDMGFDFSKNPSLDQWWDKHTKRDLERKRQEARERQSLLEATHLAGTKLIKDMTADEKRLLKRHNLI